MSLAVFIVCSYVLLAWMSHGLTGRWAREVIDHLVRNDAGWTGLVSSINAAAPVTIERGLGVAFAAGWPLGVPALYWTVRGVRKCEGRL